MPGPRWGCHSMYGCVCVIVTLPLFVLCAPPPAHTVAQSVLSVAVADTCEEKGHRCWLESALQVISYGHLMHEGDCLLLLYCRRVKGCRPGCFQVSCEQTQTMFISLCTVHTHTTQPVLGWGFSVVGQESWYSVTHTTHVACLLSLSNKGISAWLCRSVRDPADNPARSVVLVGGGVLSAAIVVSVVL